jgi:hypothetical protein
MTWSKLAFLGWITLTLLTIGLYVRGLVGVTCLSLGSVGILLNHSVLVEAEAEPGHFGYAFNDWEEFAGEEGPTSSGVIHWDKLSWGSFHADHDPHFGSEVAFPLWFPYLIASALLWPIFSRARERERKLRAQIHGEEDPGLWPVK